MGEAIPAFGAYGIELEYAIVDEDTLDVAPLAAPFLEAMPARVRIGSASVGWSNELVAHVAELKNVDPVPDLALLADPFERQVRAANDALRARGACLMPTGMHPWMDPRRESVLWTHSDADIYRTYDRIFDCRRHGWANVQSMHVNLPFADDAQFARLHDAVRLVLPLVPAIAASSPVVDGRRAAEVDHRLALYATHAERVPEIVGSVVPDAVDSRASYECHVLAPIYRAIAPLDPAGILRREWVNSRGAIARFDRNAIEIRLADTQECPRADLAVAHAICAAVKLLYEERLSRAVEQHGVRTQALADLLGRAIRDGERATVSDASFLRAMGAGDARSCTLRDLWQRLLAHGDVEGGQWQEAMALILARGPLARRICDALGRDPERARLREVYRELARCLAAGTLFA